MKITIEDARMIRRMPDETAAVQGDHLSRQIVFEIARDRQAVDLAAFAPVLCVEGVDGGCYTVFPEMTVLPEKLTLTWTLSRVDTRFAGRIYATVKFMQTREDEDVCVWQSERGCFYIAANIDATEAVDLEPPSLFEAAAAKAAEYAEQAKRYRDEAEKIKTSTGVEFSVEPYRIGLRHIGDPAFVYTDDLRGGGSGGVGDSAEITLEEIRAALGEA